MIRQLSLLWVLMLLGACTSLNPTPADSGIQGQVNIGPLCPVVQVGVDCPDKPYQASITILTSKGEEVIHFQSDADGTFEIALPPGDYILQPDSPNSLPYAPEQPFSVLKGQFTQLIVTYDSGIR
jgi:hypothetical protein